MNKLNEGHGELLGWYDPDEMREWIRKNKSPILKDKTMSVKEATTKFIKNNSYLASGGFGHVRVSMAIIHEIVRQKKKNLIISGKTGVFDLDFLVAAGCVEKIDNAYGFGLELRGLAKASRRKAESGQVTVPAEWSNAALQWRFKAAASGLSFLPGRIMLGTDTLKNSPAKVVTDPFTNKPICLIPACYPDVAIIHVHRCDKYGNAQIDANLVEDYELARAAKRLIITTEKIISTDEIRQKSWNTVIPYFYVDAVVHVPFGSHPCNMPNLYYSDEEHIAEYIKKTALDETTSEYFDKYVYNTKNFKDYLELVGGKNKINYLQQLESGKNKFKYPWVKK